MGFLWGSAAVSLSCGVSVGLAEAHGWAGPTGTGHPSPADFRILVTTSQVTQCHWSDLPACRNSAPNADSVRLSHAPLAQAAARRLSILGVLVLTPPCGRSNAALAARGMSAAWQQVSRHLWPRGAGVSIVHCGVYRRTVVHNAVISARRAASSLVGMCAMSVETILGARTPTARRSAG
jgi:hypothetical protein